jgi:GNAT superfamily N-acetyltransferase
MDEAARPATAADLRDVVALAESAHDELRPMRGGDLFFRRDARPPGEASIDMALSAPVFHVVVGTLDGVTVGYGIVYLERLADGETLGLITDLYVLPEARGVGVGAAMMRGLITFCEQNRCIGIDAVALPGNRATKNFFESFGLVARAILVHRSLVRED